MCIYRIQMLKFDNINTWLLTLMGKIYDSAKSYSNRVLNYIFAKIKTPKYNLVQQSLPHPNNYLLKKRERNKREKYE